MQLAKVNKDEDETVPVEQVKCLVLKDDVEDENEESSAGKDEEERIRFREYSKLMLAFNCLAIHGCCEACQQSCRKEKQMESGGEGVCAGQRRLKI